MGEGRLLYEKRMEKKGSVEVMAVCGGGEAGWSDESKVVLTLRDLIPVTLKPQRDNDITPSFQDGESKHCGAGPSLYTHRTHMLLQNY